MKIISLVENTIKSELKAKHGLSLYIETKKHKILFDLGPDKTLFENAVKRNIDISKVDTVDKVEIDDFPSAVTSLNDHAPSINSLIDALYAAVI